MNDVMPETHMLTLVIVSLSIILMRLNFITFVSILQVHVVKLSPWRRSSTVSLISGFLVIYPYVNSLIQSHSLSSFLFMKMHQYAVIPEVNSIWMVS